MAVQILVVIAVFAALIVLVFKGKIGEESRVGGSKAKEGVVDEERAKKYGPVAKAYLLASDMRNNVTYEVHYRSGKSALEVSKVYSPRYGELKEKEPKRLHVSGGWGSKIEVVYEDGRVVTCDCAWASFEAAGLRDQMLKDGAKRSS